jgi:hypothetical protein
MHLLHTSSSSQSHQLQLEAMQAEHMKQHTSEQEGTVICAQLLTNLAHCLCCAAEAVIVSAAFMSGRASSVAPAAAAASSEAQQEWGSDSESSSASSESLSSGSSELHSHSSDADEQDPPPLEHKSPGAKRCTRRRCGGKHCVPAGEAKHTNYRCKRVQSAEQPDLQTCGICPACRVYTDSEHDEYDWNAAQRRSQADRRSHKDRAMLSLRLPPPDPARQGFSAY